jgi:lambda repressor-like predicted transcriptional regulator
MAKHHVSYDTAQLAADIEARGFTVTAFADRAGITRRTLHRFLAGDTQSPTTAALIAKALGRTTLAAYARRVA